MSEKELYLLELLRNGGDIPEDLIEDLHSVDIANLLSEEDVPDEGIQKLFLLPDKEKLAEVLEASEQEMQARIINLLDYSLIVKLLSHLSNDDVADILSDLPINLRKKLLKLMKISDSRDITYLLGFDEDTAGGRMTTEYIALYEELTVNRAWEKIKEIATETEVIEYIFILNRQNVLVGIADLRQILISSGETLLKDIMDTDYKFVYTDMDQEEVSIMFNKYGLSVIPVINKRGALLGIITSDDVIEVMAEEQSEDILKLGGVSEDGEIEDSIMKSVKSRLPWLVINLFTALVAASAISIFDSVIAQVAALASIMTMVSGMGGNAGSQSLSLTISSIVLGEISFKKDWMLVFKEMLIGLIDGIAVGIVAGILVFVRYGNIYLCIILFLAMICNLIIAGMAGFLIPLSIKKFGGDPAMASSIFQTCIIRVRSLRKHAIGIFLTDLSLYLCRFFFYGFTRL